MTLLNKKNIKEAIITVAECFLAALLSILILGPAYAIYFFFAALYIFLYYPVYLWYQGAICVIFAAVSFVGGLKLLDLIKSDQLHKLTK